MGDSKEDTQRCEQLGILSLDFFSDKFDAALALQSDGLQPPNPKVCLTCTITTWQEGMHLHLKYVCCITAWPEPSESQARFLCLLLRVCEPVFPHSHPFSWPLALSVLCCLTGPAPGQSVKVQGPAAFGGPRLASCLLGRQSIQA